MKITDVTYPVPLTQLQDIEDGNLDVHVQLEDGKRFTVAVATPKSYFGHMDKERVDYYCGTPHIIVRSLTKENIEQAITNYAQGSAYWLKYYHLAGEIEVKTLDKALAEIEGGSRNIFDF